MRSNCDIMIALLNMKKQELESSLQMTLSEDLAPLHQFASELRKKEQQLDIMLKENKLVRSTGTSQNKLRGMQLLFAKLSSFVAFCDTGVVSKVTLRHQGVDFSDVDHAIKALSWNGSGSGLMQEKTINAQHTNYTGKKTPLAHGKKANFKLKDIVKDMQNCHLSKGSKSRSPRNSLDSSYFARFSFSSEDIPAEVGFKKSDKESSKPRRKERSLALNTVPPTLTSFWSNQSKSTSVPDGTSLFFRGNGSAGASASNSIMTRPNQESLAQEARSISSRLFDQPLDAVRGGEKQGVGATDPAGNRSAGFAGAAPRAFSPHSCSELERMSSGGSLVAQRGSVSSVTLSNTDSDSERPYACVTPITEGWSPLNPTVGFNAVPSVEEEQLLQSTAGVFTLENPNNQNTRSHSALVENHGHSGDQNITSGHNVTVDQGTSTGAALPDPDQSTLNPDQARGDSIQGVSNPDGAFSDLGQAASNSDQASPNPYGAAAGNTSVFGTGEFRFALSPAVTFKSSGRVLRKAARRLRHK
ncbi:uncharacterized protein LOC106167885 [Lingula anatina]|uniref:Uncharacterized protein LOC106167885 n=1 Tax=Lingula anatina TaxID=7574 RepID=A0A1S3IVZ4_LINAN|nr:uncharacterized protein LOC106167885 [Lingula anatina]|eukprot:XP_013402233.1 uncharacterized protein LOC106167885 [Lingula anatina]